MDAIGDKVPLLLWIYLFAFLGFGVKAAIWPLCQWLPQAGVAPTPVTALLHAVAVVKAGVFAMVGEGNFLLCAVLGDGVVDSTLSQARNGIGAAINQIG